MLDFVERPNLPEGRVRAVIIGAEYAGRLALEAQGVLALTAAPCAALPPPEASHIDLQALHLYRNFVLAQPDFHCEVQALYSEALHKESCKAIGLVKTIDLRHGGQIKQSNYPSCAAYNVLIMGNYAFYNPKCIDPAAEAALQGRYTTVAVRQGYARCSVCVVDERAAITADAGLSKALRSRGIEVLEISPGHIGLPGYDSGFIGGASFKLDKNVLAFTGSLDAHPDRDRILTFIRSRGVSPAWLSEEPVFDIGTAIPLIEERK